MPRIFDNVEQQLLSALPETLQVSYRAEFCVGYFDLRGWKLIGQSIEPWPGGRDGCCRAAGGLRDRRG